MVLPAPAEPPRVLLVDDDGSSRLLLRAMLDGLGYAVDAADGPAAARRALATPEAYVAVLTDYWMPGGTGLDILRHLQGVDRTLATVIITAEGEKSLIANLLREGANNFLDKPVQADQLRDAIARAHEATARDRRLVAAAQAARNIGRSQLHLLVQHTGSLGPRLRLFYQPCTDAGGDFATAVALGPDRFLLLASDVSGHDLQAAYQSIYFHGLARGLVEAGADLGSVFARFNDLLLQNWNRDGEIALSLAAFGATIDVARGQITALNCGFPTPVLADGAGWTRPLAAETWGPLGWFEQLPPCRQRTLEDAQLLAWSDGVEELAETLDADPLSLAAALLDERSDPATLLARATDDVVALAIDLRADPGAAPLPRPIVQRRFHGGEAGEIDLIQEFVERSLRLAVPTLPDGRRADVLLCVREALLNALVHGCRRAHDRHAELQIVHDLAGSALRVRIADDGAGHEFDAAGHERAAAEHMLTEHRGLVLLRNLPDHAAFTDRGATVTLDFRF